MPPVFGPWSPSKARLWSWAVPSKRQSSPSARTKRLASSPGMNSSMTTRAPGPSREDRVERGVRLGEGLGDGHALAGGEAVGLDHDRRALGAST